MHVYYECDALGLQIRNDTGIYSIKYLDEYNTLSHSESYSYFFIKVNEHRGIYFKNTTEI